MKKQLPNLLTLMNLLCGCIASVILLKRPQYEKVALLSFIALILDFFDGLLARLFKEQSELGRQLDSLADLISFGLVPALIMFNFLEQSIFMYPLFSSCKWSAFLIVLCSAWRLANFNIDKTQNCNFKGLPTPVNALFFIGLSILNPKDLGYDIWKYILNSSILLLIILFTSCILLISNIPMISLKFSSFIWIENTPRYLFLIFSIILFLYMHLSSISVIISLYILISILYKKHLLTYI